MDEEKIECAVRGLSNSLLSYEKPTITGSQLGDLIAKKFPELNLRRVTHIDTGPGALTKFVEMRLSDILKITGKVGADLVFSIKHDAGQYETLGENVENLALRRFVIHAVSRMAPDDLRRILIPAELALEAAKTTLRD
jgi:hypothetical protein